MKLSKRLLTVASFVPDNSYVCDVGSDHALLAIYLVSNKKNVKVIATDINEKPLEIARSNIEKLGFSKKIKVLKQDGINNIPGYINTIVIAGMGGILISEILNNKENLKNIETIIVAPNNEFVKVRKAIILMDYHIVNEKIVIDNKKTYLVIKALKGRAQKINYFFGTLKPTNLEVIYYYNNLMATNREVLKKMPKKYLIKRLKLKLENKKIKKFLLSK